MSQWRKCAEISSQNHETRGFFIFSAQRRRFTTRPESQFAARGGSCLTRMCGSLCSFFKTWKPQEYRSAVLFRSDKYIFCTQIYTQSAKFLSFTTLSWESRVIRSPPLPFERTSFSSNVPHPPSFTWIPYSPLRLILFCLQIGFPDFHTVTPDSEFL